MSRDLNPQKSTYQKDLDTLSKQRDELFNNLEKRGFSIKTSVTDLFTEYHIKDRAGCYQGSVRENAIKTGRFSGSVESQTHYNGQLFVRGLKKLSDDLMNNGADKINGQMIKLEALGFETEVRHYPNATRIKVTRDGSNEVREFNLETKGILPGSGNKMIAGWLSEVTADLKKQRERLSPAINS